MLGRLRERDCAGFVRGRQLGFTLCRERPVVGSRLDQAGALETTHRLDDPGRSGTTGSPVPKVFENVLPACASRSSRLVRRAVADGPLDGGQHHVVGELGRFEGAP